MKVVLARKSFNDAYNINHNVAHNYNFTTTGNYRSFAEAKTSLLEYIRTLREMPNTALQNNYVEWQLVLNDLSCDGKRLGEQSEQMFTKIADVLTHDEFVDNETKIEVLNDLYDPLMLCAQGAQGEIQSKFLFLQTRDLIDYVRNFVNSIAEEIFLSSGRKTIHRRNRILNGFAAKISIMPRIPLEDAYEMSDKYIDKKYDLGNFLKYVESHIAGIFAVADINFLKEDKLNSFMKKLKFLNITNDMLDNLLTIDFGGSYSKWNELLTKIVTDVERYEFINNDQVVTQEASCLYIIKTKKNDFELLLDGQKYFISKKHVKLCAGLQEYSNQRANIYELLDLFNDVVNKQSNPYIRLNTNFIHYILLQELGNIGMLSTAHTGEKWKNTILYWNSNADVIVCSMQKCNKLFFINKKSGMYLRFDEMIDNKQYKTCFFNELIELGCECNVEMLVGCEQGDYEERFAHNLKVINYWCEKVSISDELVQWLIQNPAFLNRLQAENSAVLKSLLKKFSFQQYCKFFRINIKDVDNPELFVGNLFANEIVDLNVYSSAEQHRKNICILQWLANNPINFAYLMQQEDHRVNVSAINKYLKNLMLRKLASSLFLVLLSVVSVSILYSAASMHINFLYVMFPVLELPINNTIFSVLEADELMSIEFKDLMKDLMKELLIRAIITFLPFIMAVSLVTLGLQISEVCGVVLFYFSVLPVAFSSLLYSVITLATVVNRYIDHYTNYNIENKATFKNILSLIYKVNIFANQQPEAKKVSADIENQLAPEPAVRPQLKQQPSKMVTWFYGHKRPSANVTKLASNPVLNNAVRARLEI